MNKNAQAFVKAATEIFGPKAVLSRAAIQKVVDTRSVPYPFWFVSRPEYREGRGEYRLPEFRDPEVIGALQSQETPVTESPTTIHMGTVSVLRQKKLQDDSDSCVPEKDRNYVPFGFFSDMKDIVASKMFYPIFVTGMSGNGKTFMVEQVCATLGRECVRVNISPETDESDLLGGPTLIDGNVVHRDGPVILAMRKGAVLLIDEVDRGSDKLLCLQGILEGKSYFNKKTGELIQPTNGFTVIATANSKGRGSEEGRYLSKILDDAFLERFPITVEQQYPDAHTESKIISAYCEDKQFIKFLVKWCDVIRKTFDDGGIDEVISTRRLVHIVKAYKIFNDRLKAITFCINRFDEETKAAFLDLYTKVDETTAEVETTEQTPTPV